MCNLLSAGFLRVRKSALFWGALALSFGLGAWMAFNYAQMNQYDSFTLDGAFFVYPILVCLITAVFIPLFFGPEYGSGAIRNKVTVGRSRPLIYGANLLVSMAVSLLFCVAYMTAVTVVGAPLVGFIVMDARLAVLTVLGSMVTMAAFCALFTLVVMVCSRKTVSAVICVLGVFLLLIASIYMRSRLEAPEYYTDYSLDANGELVCGDLAANPQYLSGTRRAVFEFLHDLLPSSQAVQYASQQTQNLCRMPLYALTVIVLATGAGIVLFRKKDLK